MSDTWYYALEGAQHGPVSAEEFAQRVASGSIQDDTLIWREGLEQWQPLRLVVDAPRPAPGAAPSATDGTSPPFIGERCSLCGGTFSRNDLVAYSGRLVCESCKPALLARIHEGLALPQSGRRRVPPVDPAALVEEVRQRGYTIGINALFARAWELYKESFWPSFGVSTIAMILIQATSLIPFIGGLIGILIQGPVLAGMYLYFIRRVRGDKAEIGDLFWGFNPTWWRYLLTVLVMSLPMIGFMVVVMVPVGIGIAMYSGGGGGSVPDWLPWLLVPVGIVVFLGAVYLQIAMTFALPLAADLGLGPIQSVMTSVHTANLRIGSLLLLYLTMGLTMIAGLLALVVGALFVLPLNWYVIALVYEEVFAPRQEAVAARPGTPVSAS